MPTGPGAGLWGPAPAPRAALRKAAKRATAHKGGGGGVLGALESAVGDVTSFAGRETRASGRDVVSMGEHFFPALYKIAKDTVAPGTHPSWSQLGYEWTHPSTWLSEPDPLKTDVEGMGLGMAQDVRHPLRNPVFTAADLAAIASAGAGTAFRVGAASGALRAARAGEVGGPSVAEALFTNPARLRDARGNLVNQRQIIQPGAAPHEFVPGMEGPAPARVSTGQYSRAGLGMAAQKASDAALARLADREGAIVGPRAAAWQTGRAAKWDARAEKAITSASRQAGNRVIQVGRKLNLSDTENRVLRIAAEQVPYQVTLDVAEGRIRDIEEQLVEGRQKLADAKTKVAKNRAKRNMLNLNDAEAALHQRLKWTQEAGQYLAEDEHGLPVISPEHPGLAEAYAAMEKAAGSREGMIEYARVMDKNEMAQALRDQTQMAAGAKFVKAPRGLIAARNAEQAAAKYVNERQKAYDRQVAKKGNVGYSAIERPRTRDEAIARLDDLEREKEKALDAMANQKFGPIDKAEVNHRTWNNKKARLQAAGVTASGRRSSARGFKYALKPTIKQERRNLIERSIGEGVERNPDHPAVQAWLKRENEIDQLRGAITPSPEEAFAGPSLAQTRVGQIRDRMAEIRQRQSEITDETGAAIEAGEEQGSEAAQGRFAESTRLGSEHRALAAEWDRLRQGWGKAIPPDYGTVTEFRVGHPSVERLGSALSVARDRLEKATARRQMLEAEPQGFVGGAEVPSEAKPIFTGAPTKPPLFKITGRVSSAMTFGHTRPRGSFRRALGASRAMGLERNDITELIGERQHEAADLAGIRRMVDRVKRQGTPVPTRPDDVFVWTDGKVISTENMNKDVAAAMRDFKNPNIGPLEREVLNEGGGLRRAIAGAMTDYAPKNVLGRHDWAIADDATMEKLRIAAEEGKGAFVPAKALGDKLTQNVWRLPPKVIRRTNQVNNLGRLALIYLKINYPIVQAASNVMMNLIQQGVYAPENLSHSFTLERRIGPELTAAVDDAVEQGFAGQVLRGRGQGPLSLGTAKIAHYMGLAADKMPRRAAFLHEAYALGYRTKADFERLFTDPKALPDLVQITQRAKEAIVDFGDLGPVEHDFVRHLIFVYPWMKGATVYSGRFLRDHPMQAAALANLGQMGDPMLNRAFGPRPTYEENMLPVGWGRAIDLASLNPFATPVEIGRSGVGFFRSPTSMPSEPAISYASPAVTLAQSLLTHRDEGGFPLKGDILQRIRSEMITQSPLSTLATTYAPGAVTHALFGAPIASKTYPNQNIWLKFVLGGLSPRVYDQAALNQAAAYQKAPPR